MPPSVATLFLVPGRSESRDHGQAGGLPERVGKLRPRAVGDAQRETLAVGGVPYQDNAAIAGRLYAGPAVAARVRGLTPAVHVSRISLISVSDSDNLRHSPRSLSNLTVSAETLMSSVYVNPLTMCSA